MLLCKAARKPFGRGFLTRVQTGSRAPHVRPRSASRPHPRTVPGAGASASGSPEQSSRRAYSTTPLDGEVRRRTPNLPIRAVGDEHVAAWLKGGRNSGTVKFLCTLFNDAASAPAGRLVDRNPFAKLGLRSSRGRRDTQPPSQADVARLIALADELTPPSFAAFLDVAVHEGMRPGESYRVPLDEDRLPGRDDPGRRAVVADQPGVQ